MIDLVRESIKIGHFSRDFESKMKVRRVGWDAVRGTISLRSAIGRYKNRESGEDRFGFASERYKLFVACDIDEARRLSMGV